MEPEILCKPRQDLRIWNHEANQPGLRTENIGWEGLKVCTLCRDYFNHTWRLSPCTKTWATGPLRTYTFSILSGAMYSPWASLKMFFFRSIIFRTPLCSGMTVNFPLSKNKQVCRTAAGQLRIQCFCSDKLVQSLKIKEVSTDLFKKNKQTNTKKNLFALSCPFLSHLLLMWNAAKRA